MLTNDQISVLRYVRVEGPVRFSQIDDALKDLRTGQIADVLIGLIPQYIEVRLIYYRHGEQAKLYSVTDEGVMKLNESHQDA